MLIKRFNHESITVLSISLVCAYSLFGPVLAEGSQLAGAQPASNSTHKITNNKSKTIESSSIPTFKRWKGKLSAEEFKTAAEDANKFYRIAEQKEKAGKLNEAKDLYYKCAITRSDLYGHNDSSVAHLAVKIGKIEVKQKHPNEARRWFKQSLAALSKKFGSGDYELVPVLTLLAELEAGEKNHETASSYYDHILRLQERKFGEESTQTVSTRISYIEELLADKDNFEA
jgi:tetratricopeptide (TPR) repeat protein